MREYRYYKGSKGSAETIEFDVKKGGRYITTCVMNARLLEAGIKVFPCGNGDNIKLDMERRLEVLEYLQAEREKLTAGAEIKSLDGWQASGLPTFDCYCKPGDVVTEDIVDHFLNSVPPVAFRHGFVQAGEPYSDELDENDCYRATYTTFTITDEHDGAGRSLWIYNGCCFKNGTDNRADVKTSLERQIEAVRGEIKRGERKHG